LKIVKYWNSSSANPLNTLLTACNAPQRASSRPASGDLLFRAGLSNCLLVGRIAISNGMTKPNKVPAIGPPERRPGEPCCDGAQQTQRRQGRLHDGGSAVAGWKLGCGDFDSTLHPGRMLNHADVDGGSREQATREHSNKSAISRTGSSSGQTHLKPLVIPTSESASAMLS
jgi:hypothetical protein